MPCKPNLIMAALSVAAFSAHAQPDSQVVQDMATRSANVCPGHSAARTMPTVKMVPVGALRVMLERGLVMCPDRRLEVDAPAVFFGRVGVFAWNPEVPASSGVIVKQIDTMTRKDEYPADTLVWNAKGKQLEQRTLPAFEPKPGAVVLYQIR